MNDSVYFGDIFQLKRNKNKYSWTKIFDIETAKGVEEIDYPSARNHHSANYFNEKMFVFGGRSKHKKSIAYSDIWIYNFKQNNWTRYELQG